MGFEPERMARCRFVSRANSDLKGEAYGTSRCGDGRRVPVFLIGGRRRFLGVRGPGAANDRSKNEYRERLAGLDSDCQHLSDDHDRAETGLVDHLVSDPFGEHRHVRDYLDGDRRGSRKTELVGNFDYCAGCEFDCARVFGLGGLS